jgi:hypothetical protein
LASAKLGLGRHPRFAIHCKLVWRNVLDVNERMLSGVFPELQNVLAIYLTMYCFYRRFGERRKGVEKRFGKIVRASRSLRRSEVSVRSSSNLTPAGIRRVSSLIEHDSQPES